jgi:hypothetical protein
MSEHEVELEQSARSSGLELHLFNGTPPCCSAASGSELWSFELDERERDRACYSTAGPFPVAIALANQAGGGSVARWKQGVKRVKGPSGVQAGHNTPAVRRSTWCRQAVDEAARLLVMK